jgi:hypothetical protein
MEMSTEDFYKKSIPCFAMTNTLSFKYGIFSGPSRLKFSGTYQTTGKAGLAIIK